MNTYNFLNEKLLAQLENQNATLKRRTGILASAESRFNGNVEEDEKMKF